MLQLVTMTSLPLKSKGFPASDRRCKNGALAQAPAVSLSCSALGDVQASVGTEGVPHLAEMDGATGLLMKAAGCPWDVRGEIPAEKGGFWVPRMLLLCLP